MATTTANAIGTQRQFTANPENVYEKRLVNVGAASVSAVQDNDALRLAQSLGVASNALSGILEDEQKTKDKISLARAEKVTAGLTTDDWKKMTATQIMSRDSTFLTGDDPYAVALIEKMRGKYFSSQFNSEYALWAKKQPPTKDSAVEAEQYQKYMQDRRGEVAAVAGEHEAFDIGYYDNFMPQTVQHVNNFIKERSAALDSDRIGTTSATLSNLAREYYTMPIEDTVKNVNDIISRSIMAHAQPGEIQEQLKKFAYDYADRSGNPEALKKLWSDVKWVDADGTEHTIGNSVDLENAVKTAENAKRIRLDKDTYEFEQRLMKMPKADIMAFMKKTETENNTMFQIFAPKIDNIFARKDAQEAAEAKKRLAAQARAGASQRGSQVVKNYLGLYMQGATTTASGKPIPSSTGQLKEFMKFTDADGKSHSPEDAEGMIIAEVGNQFQYYAEGSLPPEDKARYMLKLMRWGAAKPFADSFKQSLGSSLASLTPDRIDPSGKMDPVIEQALVMYHNGSEDVTDIFGSGATKDLRLLSILTDGTGSVQDAVQLFADARTNRSNTELVNTVDRVLLTAPPPATVDGYQELGGGTGHIDQTLGTHWDMLERVQEVAKSLRLTGRYTTDQAAQMAKDYAQQNYFIYQGTALPKRMFGGIDMTNKVGGGKEMIDDCISMYIDDHPDLTWDKVIIDYDEDHGVLNIRGGSYGDKTWGVSELTNYINNKGAAWAQSNQNGTPYTAAGINAERDAGDAQQQLPEGSYFGI